MFQSTILVEKQNVNGEKRLTPHALCLDALRVLTVKK